MKPHARKTNWLLWLIILGAVNIAAYYVSALFVLPGVTLENINEKLQYAVLHPWPPLKYYNEYTKSCLLAACMIWVIAFSNYLSKNRTYMFGKEHGTADWADIREFNKEFAEWIWKKAKKIPEGDNRILSMHARISYDSRKTDVNNNQLVVGGSGSRKTTSVISPNLLKFHGSNIYTDPKGGLLKQFGKTLEKNGIIVKSINLCDMRQSIQYNPFDYIGTQNDLEKLITNIMDNTTPKEAHSNDPFWEAAEAMYLKAIFNYVWLECPREEVVTYEDEYGQNQKKIRLERNFRSVLYLLDEAKVPTEKNTESPLTVRMEKLKRENPRHENHPAWKNYNRCVQAAGDTLRSIIICANSRFSKFDNEELLRILDHDEADLRSIGVGKNGDGKTKTAFFCIIPDEDKTYNAVIGMFYTQLLQILYAQARTFDDDRLPLDVGFWLDEFKNIKMPDNFLEFLSGCRSRGIYCTVVVQSLTQLKDLYKDAWEGVSGDCNTFIYLGGFEAFTHEYLSKQLGEMTIYKKSNSQSRGSHGSTSTSEDIIARALMKPDEISRMSRRHCIVRVYGHQPIYDKKYNLYVTKDYIKARALGKYVFRPEIIEDEMTGVLTTLRPETSFSTLGPESLDYYKNAAQRGENVKIISLTEEELDAMELDAQEEDLAEIQKTLQENQEQIRQKMEAQKKRIVASKEAESGQNTSASSRQQDVVTQKPVSLMEMLMLYEYDDDQISEIRAGQDAGLPEDVIMQYADQRNTAEKMRWLREMTMQKMG